VCASAAQAQRLLDWAAAWPQRTSWAIEGAGGLGHLLAQQLLAAGEQVVDVQPKLGARVRLLAAGDTNKKIEGACRHLIADRLCRFQVLMSLSK
jgi:transposase